MDDKDKDRVLNTLQTAVNEMTAILQNPPDDPEHQYIIICGNAPILIEGYGKARVITPHKASRFSLNDAMRIAPTISNGNGERGQVTLLRYYMQEYSKMLQNIINEVKEEA